MIWDHTKYVGMDYETSGVKPEYALQPWRIQGKQAWATSLVWTHYENQNGTWCPVVAGGLFPKRSQIRAMLEFAKAEGRTIVCWNAVFDISVCIGYGFYELVMQNQWLDGMLLWKHLFVEPDYDDNPKNRKSYALKPGGMAEFLPQYAGYEEAVDYHSTDPAELAKLHAYNVKDVDYTLQIAKIIFERLTDKQLTAAMLEAACLPMVAAANFQGMLVDVPELHEHGAALIQTSKAMLEKLAPHGVTEKVVRSPIQLSKLMFDVWELEPFKYNTSKKKVDAAGKPVVTRSTDKEVLHELGLFDERAKWVRDYRESLNLKTKFVDTVLESQAYNGDGRTRPQAIVSGTYTGRLTYSSKQGKNKDERQTGFAIHQMKNAKRFRDAVIAPPGYTIVEFDAAGQEFRWMAIYSKDPTMLQLCEPGEDPHAFMASKISHLDYHWIMANKETDKDAKRVRKSGKVGNLCNIAHTPVLTDRGHVAIQDVRRDDLIWDGIEFVTHDGVSFSGVLPVISHDGVTATPDHKVLVDGQWVELREAAQQGLRIDTSRHTRNTVRIVGGIIGRVYQERARRVRAVAMRLWGDTRDQLTHDGGWEDYTVQGVRSTSHAQGTRPHEQKRSRNRSPHQTCRSVASALLQSQRWVIPQLRWAWDRVSICFNQSGGKVYPTIPTPSNISQVGHRPHKQRRSLRSWKLAFGSSQSEFAEHAHEQPRPLAWRVGDSQGLAKSVFSNLYYALLGKGAFWRRYPTPSVEGCVRETQGLAQDRSEAPCYDIVNCGPRTRFSANGRIVHNSLQYRTSPTKFVSVARVQHDIPMLLPEGKKIWSTYRQTYKKVPDFWSNQIANTAAKGYVQTLAGRRVQVKGDWGGKNGWRMESTSINTPIQGTGADQKYLALMMVRNTLVDYGAYFMLDMHDGLYFLVPDGNVARFCEDTKDTLDNLPYQAAWGFSPSIPLPFDCKVGKSWGSLKEWSF